MFRRAISLTLSIGVSLLVFATPRLLEAQITGSIFGVVRDASGAVLPGATVIATSPALQRESLATVTNDVGAYRLSLLPAGLYSVRFELPGFNPSVHSAIEVAVNQEVALDVTLEVAAVSETVEVSARTPQVETTRADVSSRVSTDAIDALPLNGRNFEDLITLVPGAKSLPEGSQGQEVSIFGERGSAVSYVVDGADNNDPLVGGAFQRYTQDSIQEFEVITTGYEAEFGRAQGGVVNIITRSGTNQLSGSAFGFFRDDALDSSNVPDQEVPKLERQQWGGTLGGPISADRAFFFGSFEVLDETRGVNIDRSQIADFVQQGLATPSGVEDFGLGPKTDGFTGLFKLDWNLNPSNRLTFSLNRTKDDVSGEISSPIAGTIALPSAERTELRESTGFTARESWTINDVSFLETNFRFIDGRGGNNLERNERLEPVLVLLRSGFLQTGSPFGGKFERNLGRLQVSQALSLFKDQWNGDHQFKLGWDWTRADLTGFNEVTNDVEYSAAFLAPNAADIQGALFEQFGFEQSAARFFTLSANPDGSLDLDMKDNGIGIFFQDEWRPRSDLTLNLGLRYDWSSLFGDDKNNLAPRAGFAWDIGAEHLTVVKANFGIFFDRNLLNAAATVPELGGIFTRSAFDVALPRLGVDYTDSLIDLVITSGFPTGGGGRTPAENPNYRTFADDLRANPLALYELLGIAVSDPSLPPVVTADNIQQLSGLSPEEAVALLESTYPGTDWEFFDVPGGSIVGDGVLSFFPRGPLALSRDVSRYSEAKTPWTRAFNVGVDRQVTPDLSLSVTYVHRRSRDLLTRRITNLYDVAPGDPNFGRTTDGGPRISQVTYDGRIDYDGVVIEVRKRFSDRYMFGISYTGSRARDNLLTGAAGSGFSDNNDPENDYGPSNLSAPHIFVTNGSVNLPGDINVSGILNWQSGAAFNPRGITDQDGDGLVDQRDVSVPRNDFRTDPLFNVDLRVEKVFRIANDHSFGILVEAFNLTNQANVLNVNSVSGPDFGTPVAYYPGREIQIGVRYLFGR
ncbi:MAG TPA: TonB-dependent receptor [Vicinamibacteria bacterium]|nr:TonB-dependent receptor [Vicinamibacteria bacterium]